MSELMKCLHWMVTRQPLGVTVSNLGKLGRPGISIGISFRIG